MFLWWCITTPPVAYKINVANYLSVVAVAAVVVCIAV